MVPTLLLFVNRRPEGAREEKNDYMKKIIYLFSLLFLFIGCGEDAKNEIEPMPQPEPPYDYFEFGGYHLKDTAGFDKESIELYVSNDTTWLFGIKNQKPWFGLFKSDTKEQISEWTSIASLSSDYKCTISHNPYKISMGYIFLVQSGLELYKSFLLKEEKAIPLNEQKVAWGSEQFFIVKELGNDILVYHPHFSGSLYSSEGTEIVNSVAFQEQSNSEYDFLSGFKGDKVWLGVYEDGRLMHEYVSEDAYERNIKINKGYGEFEEYYVRTLSFGGREALLKTSWGYVFSPISRDNESGGYIHDMFFCKEGKMVKIFVGKNYLDIRNWYEDSVLEYTSKEYIIYSSDGKMILRKDVKQDHNGDVFMSGLQFPVSYTDFLVVSVWYWLNGKGEIRLRKYDFDSFVGTPIWSKVLDYTVRENAKVSCTLLGSQSTIWQYQIDVLNYDGSSQQIKFSVDINTGDIKDS